MTFRTHALTDALPRLWGLALGLSLLGSCGATVKVEPVEVKPIKLTIDVNIKVDRQLDEFFDFEDEIDSEKKPNTKQGSTR